MIWRLVFASLVVAWNIEVLPPTATLTPTNQCVAPDGVNRSATVINGGVQGPLITGFSVSMIICSCHNNHKTFVCRTLNSTSTWTTV
jgi:hypothetical protein